MKAHNMVQQTNSPNTHPLSHILLRTPHGVPTPQSNLKTSYLVLFEGVAIVGVAAGGNLVVDQPTVEKDYHPIAHPIVVDLLAASTAVVVGERPVAQTMG